MIIKDSSAYTGPSCTLRDRIYRQLWNVVGSTLFAWSPRPFHGWRALLLRAFGAQIGKDCHVYPKAKIWAPRNLKLGDRVGIGDGVTLYSMETIEIGAYAVISQGAHLCCGTHDYNAPTFQLVARPISVGAYAWICAEVFIHPGVALADGVVVGARSVVTKSLAEPWTVYSGHPCVRVGSRRNFLEQA